MDESRSRGSATGFQWNRLRGASPPRPKCHRIHHGPLAPGIVPPFQCILFPWTGVGPAGRRDRSPCLPNPHPRGQNLRALGEFGNIADGRFACGAIQARRTCGASTGVTWRRRNADGQGATPSSFATRC